MSQLPKNLREKLDEAFYKAEISLMLCYIYYEGAESLWKILTEMSKDEEKAIEVESLAALSVDGPAIKRDIFYQGARFGLALGRVKFENIDTIVQNQTVAILEYDEHITELESKLAVAAEALKDIKDHSGEQPFYGDKWLNYANDVASEALENMTNHKNTKNERSEG